MTSPRRALVTGASGFVGSNLARRLLREGHRVDLLLRPGHAGWRLAEIEGEVRQHAATLADRDAVARVIDEVRPDWVFHLAAHGAYSTQRDHLAMIETNVVGTVNLVDACVASGVEALVNAGSSSEYGFKDAAPAETAWLDPNSHYAVTKACATHYGRLTARTHPLRVTTLRLYSVYGPYEEPTRLIPSLIVHGLRGALPPLVAPDVARDFVYAEDVVDAFLL